MRRGGGCGSEPTSLRCSHCREELTGMFFPVLMNHSIFHEDRLIPADSWRALQGQGSHSVPRSGQLVQSASLRVPGYVTCWPLAPGWAGLPSTPTFQCPRGNTHTALSHFQPGARLVAHSRTCPRPCPAAFVLPANGVCRPGGAFHSGLWRGSPAASPRALHGLVPSGH